MVIYSYITPSDPSNPFSSINIPSKGLFSPEVLQKVIDVDPEFNKSVERQITVSDGQFSM